ncbi:hypothetical protein ACUJ8N_20315 [Streptomyces sp. ESR1.13]|uniref:hypothetical protein n=1 Tax=Streptomyces TaxID=1883 RepID=UPI000A40086C|nr:hypothetical protein [Streptomyces ardesiacus]MCL7369299.1 hypothetical protein [Streptomyces ardesiacus]
MSECRDCGGGRLPDGASLSGVVESVAGAVVAGPHETHASVAGRAAPAARRFLRTGVIAAGSPV